MKEKIKTAIPIVVVIILIVGSIISVMISGSTIEMFMDTYSKTYIPSTNEQLKLEREKWRFQIENTYMQNYCNILEKLPSENSTVIENTTVHRYEEPFLITTPINPYPKDSSVYEVGAISTINLKELDDVKHHLRLYKIELNEDPTTYIEYISHKDKPELYIVQDHRSDNFLLYPIVQYVNAKYYINITEK